MAEAEHNLAVFIDFENLALGFKGKKEKRFEIQRSWSGWLRRGRSS